MGTLQASLAQASGEACASRHSFPSAPREACAGRARSPISLGAKDRGRGHTRRESGHPHRKPRVHFISIPLIAQTLAPPRPVPNWAPTAPKVGPDWCLNGGGGRFIITPQALPPALATSRLTHLKKRIKKLSSRKGAEQKRACTCPTCPPSILRGGGGEESAPAFLSGEAAGRGFFTPCTSKTRGAALSTACLPTPHPERRRIGRFVLALNFPSQ